METPADQISTEPSPAAAPPAPPVPPASPSQADIEAEAAARRAAEPQTHEASATATVDVSPSAPAAPAAPEPPAPVGPPAATSPAPAADLAPAPSAIPAGPPAPSPDAPAASDKVMDGEWPFKGYTGPQPWEAENTPVLTQEHKMLSPGSAGDEVVALCAVLGTLGYANSITSGQNPHAVFDESVDRAVEAFCRDYGVEEDPAIKRARTPETVGPWIWEALCRASQKKAIDEAGS